MGSTAAVHEQSPASDGNVLDALERLRLAQAETNALLRQILLPLHVISRCSVLLLEHARHLAAWCDQTSAGLQRALNALLSIQGYTAALTHLAAAEAAATLQGNLLAAHESYAASGMQLTAAAALAAATTVGLPYRWRLCARATHIRGPLVFSTEWWQQFRGGLVTTAFSSLIWKPGVPARWPQHGSNIMGIREASNWGSSGGGGGWRRGSAANRSGGSSGPMHGLLGLGAGAVGAGASGASAYLCRAALTGWFLIGALLLVAWIIAVLWYRNRQQRLGPKQPAHASSQHVTRLVPAMWACSARLLLAHTPAVAAALAVLGGSPGLWLAMQLTWHAILPYAVVMWVRQDSPLLADSRTQGLNWSPEGSDADEGSGRGWEEGQLGWAAAQPSVAPQGSGSTTAAGWRGGGPLQDRQRQLRGSEAIGSAGTWLLSGIHRRTSLRLSAAPSWFRTTLACFWLFGMPVLSGAIPAAPWAWLEALASQPFVFLITAAAGAVCIAAARRVAPNRLGTRAVGVPPSVPTVIHPQVAGAVAPGSRRGAVAPLACGASIGAHAAGSSPVPATKHPGLAPNLAEVPSFSAPACCPGFTERVRVGCFGWSGGHGKGSAAKAKHAPAANATAGSPAGVPGGATGPAAATGPDVPYAAAKASLAVATVASDASGATGRGRSAR